ncbi:unnamed protein product [Urochloa humidicola]
MASSEVRRHCDTEGTELSLGRRLAHAQPEEEKAPATPCAAVGGGLTVTELQATAILLMARRAEAAEKGPARRPAAGDGAEPSLSMRRSLEWFLKRRWKAGRRRGVAADAVDTMPSSSSSCLPD